MNLMNPSSMMGMASSGHPGMPSVKPGDMFRVEGLTDNSEGLFGSGTWNNPVRDGQDSPVAWLATNGPNKNLMRPVMANPVDPMGIMGSRGARQTRSASEWQRGRRSVDEASRLDTNNADFPNAVFFDFDPNQFSYQPGEEAVGHGINSRGGQLLSTGGGGGGSLATSDFGISMASSSISGSASQSNSQAALYDHDKGSSWHGQWPGVMESIGGGSSSSDEDPDDAPSKLSSILAVISGETHTSRPPKAAGEDLGEASRSPPGGDASWDGSWTFNWPGLQEKLSESARSSDKTVGQIGAPIAKMIDENMGEANQGLTNQNTFPSDQSQHIPEESEKTASAWDSHFRNTWKVR